jgi:hypothetical protein
MATSALTSIVARSLDSARREGLDVNAQMLRAVEKILVVRPGMTPVDAFSLVEQLRTN